MSEPWKGHINFVHWFTVQLLIHSVPCETDLRPDLKLCSVGQYWKRETFTLPNLLRKFDYECGWPDALNKAGFFPQLVEKILLFAAVNNVFVISRVQFHCIISNNLLQIPVDSIRKYYKIPFMVTLTSVILTTH